MKQVVLARPNSFIVENMKRLMLDGGFTPVPVSSQVELASFDFSHAAGVVISTALTSTVKEDYHEVVKVVKELNSGTPIMLASLIDFETVRKAIEIKFKSLQLQYRLLSIEEASLRNRIDPTTEVLVIQKNDISNPSLYGRSLAIVKKYFA